MNDPVNHPSHYTSDPSGVECIQITRHRNFNIGNAIKYLWRAGLKDSDTSGKHIEDLRKAVFYINDEIKRLEAEQPTPWVMPDMGAGPHQNIRTWSGKIVNGIIDSELYREETNAAQEGQVTKVRIIKHPYRNGGWEIPEASGCDCVKCSR